LKEIRTIAFSVKFYVEDREFSSVIVNVYTVYCIGMQLIL